ncbi:MAG: exonuclease SbcCD subunit D C-terminal domain-containing protein [Magnetococcales bacterium]|nr:exonuclease SbcCD subunit D C-terminal domain-containing protein [Magnetococcales bacterium]
MRICHTSDWHLGHLLRGQKRDAEFAAFLDWLIATLRDERVEALLIAGDLFDGTTPSHRAQELYYRFLARVGETGCRHVVVIGGNHDSPSLLEAPKTLLAALNVRVIGAIGADPTEEVVVLEDPDGHPEAIICAVPYLRDRDIRLAEAEESGADKDRKWLEGIFAHYAAVIDIARARRDDLGGSPLVVMGHLFVAGGQVREGDGMRELYVGSLARVPVDLFPADVDYVALGHLHQAQQVGASGSRRYSGAPLALGFGEVGVTKSLCLVDLAPGQSPVIRLLPVPIFQKLARLQGDRDALLDQLHGLLSSNETVWVELLYTGSEPIGDLREQMNKRVEDSPVVILALRDARLSGPLGLGGADDGGTHLEALTPDEVFLRCLELRRIPEAQRPALIQAHDEILAALLHDDPGAG